MDFDNFKKWHKKMPHYEGGARFGTMIRGGKPKMLLLK